jgi:dihydrofolate synthase/folylpolyglutamate synthase
MVSVITSIGMDHQRWLGNTLAEIAGEKAGIIKPGVPVITLPQEPEALAVLRSTSAALASPMQEIEQPWQGPLGLAGAHQRWNAAAAVAASRIIHPGLQKSAVADALARVSWPGRFQRIAPNIILDGAHNPAAASALAAAWIENFPGQKAYMIFGALEDKAVAEVLSLLDPICEDIVFVSAPSPRALSPQALQHLSGRGSCCPDLRQALEVARQADGPILITGSLFLVGEAVALLEGNPTPRSSMQ